MTCGKGRIMSEKTNKVKGSRSDYLQGLKDGLPIGLGYLSVSFAFGITAVGMKIPPLAAILISMTCLTSAGQVAGIGAIAAGGGLFEIALAHEPFAQPEAQQELQSVPPAHHVVRRDRRGVCSRQR